MDYVQSVRTERRTKTDEGGEVMKERLAAREA